MSAFDPNSIAKSGRGQYFDFAMARDFRGSLLFITHDFGVASYL